MIANNNISEHYSPGSVPEQELFLSCPKGHVIYDAGISEHYKGITDGNINLKTKVVCRTHEEQRYWQTEQGGKLFIPRRMSMPGCNCLKGEV